MKKTEKHEAGNAETILKETSNFSLLTQSSGREDRLCPPRDIRGKLAKGGGEKRGAKGGKKKCKDFAKLLSRLKDRLSQLLSDQEDRKGKKKKKKQPWSPYIKKKGKKKKHFLSQPSQESPHRQNYTVTFKGFAFKRWRGGLNAARFPPVTIETLEKVENSVR